MIPRKRQDVRLDTAAIERVGAIVPLMPAGATLSDAYRLVIERGAAWVEARGVAEVPAARPGRVKRAGRGR